MAGWGQLHDELKRVCGTPGVHVGDELAAAYEQQLREQAESADRFLGTLANLCENEACTGHILAWTLRGLSRTGKLQATAHASKNATVCHGDENAHMLAQMSGKMLGTPLREGLSSCTSSPCLPVAEEWVTSTPPPVPLGVGSPAPASRSRRSRKTSPAVSTNFPSPDALRKSAPKFCSDHQDVAARKDEFVIAKCSFISEQSQIIKLPGDLERFLGPTAIAFKERLKLKASGYAEHKAGRLSAFVDGSAFKTLSIFVICLNFIFIIVQTNHKMTHLHGEKPAAHFVVEILFTLFYVFELGAQIAAHRKAFFIGADMLWNWFDFIIVFVAVIEILMSMLGQAGGSMSFLRVLRFMKVSRVFRMFNAMREFKEIRIMIDALMGSFVFFVWCACMLGLFLSLFAIFFVQGMTGFMEDRADLDEDLRKAITQDFGSVSQAMLTLLLASTGGQDWGEYHLIVKELGAVYNFLYLFFVLYSSMAFFNVITSVFCEKAMHLARPTMDEMMVDMKNKEVHDATELLSMLDKSLDGDGSRMLDHQSFENFISHPHVIAYFEQRGLNESSIRRFFGQLLRTHQTQHIDFGTFVSACVKLGGPASCVDVHTLSAEMEAVKVAQMQFQEFLTGDLTGAKPGPAFEVPPAALWVASPCRDRSPWRDGGALLESSTPLSVASSCRPQALPECLPRKASNLTSMHKVTNEGAGVRGLSLEPMRPMEPMEDSPLCHSDEYGEFSEEIDLDVSPDRCMRMILPVIQETTPLRCQEMISV